ncbi:MAG: hypothetical protein AAF604_23080 [Acidobacteriota bacterium]
MKRWITAAFALLWLGALAACSSPNRGAWGGTFDGSVAGVVEFRINARGTALEGRLEGETVEGQPFVAEMEGRIEGSAFYATFEGDGRAGLYPVPFKGFMKGILDAGRGAGDWEAQLEDPLGRPQGGKLIGTWTVEQLAGS